MRFTLAALGLAWCLAACGSDSGPVTIHVFGLDPSTQRYGYYDARLSTLTDATQMRGQVVAMRGGATIVVDAVAASSSDNPAQTLLAEGGSTPSCDFSAQSGVLYPNDFDSLAMASSYAAIERARALYRSLGVVDSELNTINAYYNPNIQALTKLVPTFWYMTDNAAYAAPFDGMLIVPQLILQDVPFEMNLGVMGHEYGHKVHNHLVDLDASNPHWNADHWSTGAANQYRGIDEGLADIFGGTLAGDSNYIEPSIAHAGDLGIDRDMAKVRVIDSCQTGLALGQSSSCSEPDGGSIGFDPHVTGAYVASTLWQLGLDQGDHQAVAQAVIDTERALGSEIRAATPAAYDYGIVPWWNHFLAQEVAQPGGVADLCTMIQARFAVLLATEAPNGHHLDPTLCPGAP